VIFVHSSFRTGSTYLWSCFRKCSRTISYYEIFHESLNHIRKSELCATGPETWHSKHPSGAPYFLEFLPLLRGEGGIEGFDPGMSYERFIPEDGCGSRISGAEASYVTRLIGHAESRGRIPVLTATRSLGRLRGLKAALPGLHMLLYRNLFQQWCSITDQAFRGNPYFIHRIADIVRLSGHDPILNDLRQVFPIVDLSVKDANTFYTFVFLHLHIYVQAAGAADMIVDLNQLAANPIHRKEVEKCILDQDLKVDLSGVRNSIAYSVCELGSAADVGECLKVIGDMVIDRAPDEAGRSFGAKVLSELIEEYNRHEFQTHTLRSMLLGPRGLLADSENLLRERDAAFAERDAMRVERDNIGAERDAALAERDAIRVERDNIGAERDAALAERDAMRVERDNIGAERDAALAERDAMRVERDNIGAEGDAALAERDAMRVERDNAGAERDAALAGRVSIQDQAERFAKEINKLRSEYECLAVEQAALRKSSFDYGNRVECLIRSLVLQWLGTGSRREMKERVRWRRKGDASREARNWLEAAHAYERYLNIEPSDDAIWVQYGHALKEAGILRSALIAYERSRELNPNDLDRDIHLFHLEQRISGTDGCDGPGRLNGFRKE
jgi:tetratricopeptide (TPR) repeat protein